MGRWPAPTEVAAVLVDARESRRVYAGGPGGLFLSTDAGRTWQAAAVGTGRGRWVALAQDQRRPQNLFAAMVDGTLFRSRDGGATWRRVQ
ncbi:MAG: WD40/YVTN/BNR-like repeat-containing protein [bacterium]